MTDIFSILKSDHELHRQMLAKIAETSGDTPERRDLFEAFRIEVTAHAAAEEQSLYANMLADPALQEDGRHSVAEHKELDDMLGELQDTDMATGAWLTKFKDMRPRYEHQIEEEEDEMFPAAQEQFSKAKAKELGVKFDHRKPEEMEVAEASDNGSDKE
ncbi:MAG: hemerythrin domain-containing protein [Chakrabartia sp.]